MRGRFRLLHGVVALAACGAPAAQPAQPQLPSNQATAAAPPAACDPRDNATDALACARDALDHDAYDIADQRAAFVIERFPYSKRAVEAEELRADIAARRGRYADAYRLYTAWLRAHPTNDRVDAVRRKAYEAQVFEAYDR